MRLKKYGVMIFALSAFIIFSASNENMSNRINIQAEEPPTLIDTRYKSADAQFECALGTIIEMPVFDSNNEKIKNILYLNTTEKNLNKENLTELRDIILDSGYDYNEVIIALENEQELKYNPFSDEVLYRASKDDRPNMKSSFLERIYE